MKPAVDVIADATKAHEAASRAVLSGITTAYSDSFRQAINHVTRLTTIPIFPFAEITAAMDTHNIVSRQLSAVLSAVNFSAPSQILAAHANFEKQLRKALRVQTDFAAISEQITRLTRFASTMRISEVVASAIAEAGRLEGEQENEVRDGLFAGYEGTEYLAERKEIESELATIPDFDSMSPIAKCFQYLTIAVKSQSARIQSIAFNLAGNIFANILSNGDAGVWLVLFLVMGLMGTMSENVRVPRTRKLLRAAHIDNPRIRIVDYPCIVSDQPKAKAPRVGCLDRGAIVTISDKMQGWRQICVVDTDEEERFGWVRSKYLRRVNRT